MSEEFHGFDGLSFTRKRKNLTGNELTNVDFILFYLLVNGPTERNTLRKALITWRQKPSHYYVQYFWNMPENPENNYYGILWAQEYGPYSQSKKYLHQRMYLTSAGVKAAREVNRRICGKSIIRATYHRVIELAEERRNAALMSS